MNAGAAGRLAWTHISPSSSCVFSCSATFLLFSGGTWQANVSVTDSTVRFTYSVGGTDTLTATTASGTTYTSATASLKLFL